MAYFWEDWDLMCWLSDERPEVYFRYIDRMILRAKQGRMSGYDMGRFHQFLYRMKKEHHEDFRRLKFLLNKTNPSGLRVVRSD